MYQEDAVATKSRFEIANRFGKLRSQTQPFDGQSLRGSSIGTTPNLSNGGVGASARDEAWTELVDTLEDFLSESNEFVASMTLAQDTLITELEENCKHMKTVVVQNTKLTAILEANLGDKGEKDGSKSPGGVNSHRKKHTCNNCSKEISHEDDDCFTLAKNKDYHPTWYTE